MLTWICPLCGRECQENEIECLGCNPDAVVVVAAASNPSHDGLATQPEMSGSATATAVAEPPHWHEAPAQNPWPAESAGSRGAYERAPEQPVETPALHLPTDSGTSHAPVPALAGTGDGEFSLHTPPALPASPAAPPATPHLHQLADAIDEAPAYRAPESTFAGAEPAAETGVPVPAPGLDVPMGAGDVTQELRAVGEPALPTPDATNDPGEAFSAIPYPIVDAPAPAAMISPVGHDVNPAAAPPEPFDQVPPLPVSLPIAPASAASLAAEPVPALPPSFNWLDQAVPDELPTAKIDRPVASQTEPQTEELRPTLVLEPVPEPVAEEGAATIPLPRPLPMTDWRSELVTPETAVPPVPVVADPPAISSIASNLDFETMEMQIPSQDFLARHFGPVAVPRPEPSPSWSTEQTWETPSWQEELTESATVPPLAFQREDRPPFEEWSVPSPLPAVGQPQVVVDEPAPTDALRMDGTDTPSWSVPAFGAEPAPVPPVAAAAVEPSVASAPSIASHAPEPRTSYDLSPVLANRVPEPDLLSTNPPDDDWDRLMADLSTAEYEARWGVQATGTHAVASDGERTAQHRAPEHLLVPAATEPALDSPFSLDHPLTGEGERTQQFRLPVPPVEPAPAPEPVYASSAHGPADQLDAPAFSAAASNDHWTASLELADPLSQTIQAPQMNLPPSAVNLYETPSPSLTPEWGTAPPLFGTPSHPLEDWSSPSPLAEPVPAAGPSFLGSTPSPAQPSIDHWGHRAFPTEEPAFSGSDLGSTAVKDRDLLNVPLPPDHWSLKKSDVPTEPEAAVSYARTGAHPVALAVNLDPPPITPDMPSNQTAIPTIPPPIVVAPRRGLGMVAMLLIGLLLAGGAAMFIGSKLGGSSSAQQQAGLPSAAIPTNNHPLSKHLEIVGFRVIPGEGISGKVRFIVVNHSKGPVSNASLDIVLKSLTNAPEPETAARFKVNLPQLGAEESTEIEAGIHLNNTVNTATWQNLRPEFSIY